MRARSCSIRVSAQFPVTTSSIASSSAGNSPGRRPGGTLRALASSNWAARRRRELRDDDGLQVGRPVPQPPGRLQRPGQLVVGQPPRPAIACSVRAASTGPGRSASAAAPCPKAGLRACPPRPSGPSDRRQQGGVQVAGVAEAERDRRALDLPLLRDPLPARLEVGDPPRQLRVRVEVILGRAPAGGPSRGRRREAVRPAPAAPGARRRARPGWAGRGGSPSWSCSPTEASLPALAAYIFIMRTYYRDYEDQLKRDAWLFSKNFRSCPCT